MFLRDISLIVLFVLIDAQPAEHLTSAHHDDRFSKEISALLDTFLKVPPIIATRLVRSLAEDLRRDHENASEVVINSPHDFIESRSNFWSSVLSPRELVEDTGAHYNIFEAPGVALLKFLVGTKPKPNDSNDADEDPSNVGPTHHPDVNDSLSQGDMVGKGVKRQPAMKDLIDVTTIDRKAILRALFILIGVCLFTSLLLIILISCTSAVTVSKRKAVGGLHSDVMHATPFVGGTVEFK